MSTDSLRLIVETPIGMVTRTIPNASPLREGDPPGTAAEAATRDAAAVWGLPDFVYRGQRERTGSGSRELGDGLLVVGDLGVVVQVKCREAPGRDADRERRWILKNVGIALRQADGTVRRLTGGTHELTNARGRRIAVNGPGTQWICVVVIEHPSPPADVLPKLSQATTPAVVMLRRDWEFLFDQLKSTYAVVAYLTRAADDPVVLGEEPLRYYSLANADHNTTPHPVDPRLLTLNKNARVLSTPSLPLQTAATDDEVANLLVRSVLEDIATSRMTRGEDESGRLRVLAELDRLPIGDRGMVGRFLMSSLKLVISSPPTGILWSFRRIVGATPDLPRPLHLGFGACSGGEDIHREMFLSWVQLRHYELQEQIGRDQEFMSLGVLLTPRDGDERDWDTTLSAVAGNIDFTAAEYTQLSEFWKLLE